MEKHIKEHYDYFEIVSEIEAKYKVSLSDYAGKHTKNLENKITKEYMTAPDGQAAEPPYLNFWHYAMDNIFYHVHNGTSRYFDPWEAQHQAEGKNKDGELDWVIEILGMFISLFEENKIENPIEVSFCW